MSASLHTRRFAPDAPLRFHASPPLPHRRSFRACTAAKCCRATISVHASFFGKYRYCLTHLKCPPPSFKNRQMPCLQLRRVGQETFVAGILRNSSRSPSQLQYQPALKITPVGLFTFLCSQNYLRTLGICSIFAMPTVRLPLAQHGPKSLAQHHPKYSVISTTSTGNAFSP